MNIIKRCIILQVVEVNKTAGVAVNIGLSFRYMTIVYDKNPCQCKTVRQKLHLGGVGL